MNVKNNNLAAMVSARDSGIVLEGLWIIGTQYLRWFTVAQALQRLTLPCTTCRLAFITLVLYRLVSVI